MTFYNIVFGLLAVGAFREVIFALAQGPDWRLFCLTATLSVLVFSDAIYTAVVIEAKKSKYSMEMKLLDLLNFVLLSFAVVILNPRTNDMFEVDVIKVLRSFTGWIGFEPEVLFWGLLTGYMFILALWNKLLDAEPIMWCDRRWVRCVQPSLALLCNRPTDDVSS